MTRLLLLIFVPVAVFVLVLSAVVYLLVAFWRMPWLKACRDYGQAVGGLAVSLWLNACDMWRAA